MVLFERSGRDRARWQQMRDQFHAVSTVSLSWFMGSGHDFVAGSEDMHAAGDRTLHRLGPPIVRLRGDRALAEISATIGMRVDVDGVPAFLASDARLNYRFDRAPGGSWGIRSIDAIYEHDTLRACIPRAELHVDPRELSDLRESYALLSWILGGRGHQIRTDLLGDDRPDEVDAFYAAEDGGLTTALR
jgi:hypothetical protein